MRKSPSVLLALALAAAVPASATVYWVPSPTMGNGRKPTTHLEVTGGGTRKLDVAFVESGKTGVGVQGTLVNVNNDVKPNVFNVTRQMGVSGMLRIENDPGPGVVGGSILFNDGPNTLAWQVPVLSEANWFKADETAFIHGMERNSAGHANLEIMNFAPRQAVCEVRLLRPKGTPIGTPKTVALLPLSHRVVTDPFLGEIAGPAAAGMRATVTCDEPFYAFGTFASTDTGRFRFLYPLSAPPAPVAQTVSVNRPGLFFAPKQGNSELVIELPLLEGVSYRKVTLDFDVRVSQFTPIFTGLVGMSRKGGVRFNRTLYFGTFVRGFRSKSMVDLGSAVVEPSLRVNTNWREGETHHVSIVFDTESATTSYKVTRGGTVLTDVTGSAYNLDLAPRGENPVKLTFGLAGVADHAYFPPLGWRFQNLQVRVTR